MTCATYGNWSGKTRAEEWGVCVDAVVGCFATSGHVAGGVAGDGVAPGVGQWGDDGRLDVDGHHRGAVLGPGRLMM